MFTGIVDDVGTIRDALEKLPSDKQVGVGDIRPGRHPDLPSATVGAGAGRDVLSYRTLKVLADLDPADVDMRCLLIIGSSQTQWYDDIVFTPRRYPT